MKIKNFRDYLTQVLGIKSIYKNDEPLDRTDDLSPSIGAIEFFWVNILDETKEKIQDNSLFNNMNQAFVDHLEKKSQGQAGISPFLIGLLEETLDDFISGLSEFSSGTYLIIFNSEAAQVVQQMRPDLKVTYLSHPLDMAKTPSLKKQAWNQLLEIINLWQ